MTTLWSYLDNGRSLEATARELFVHPNTVRYRLKRVSEVIGWDATGAREALILQAALILGSIGEPDCSAPTFARGPESASDSVCGLAQSDSRILVTSIAIRAPRRSLAGWNT